MIQLPYIFRSGLGLVMSSAIMLAAISCTKEGKITPTEENRPFNIPQGNQPVDQEIVQFRNKYNSYILYNFEAKDYNYTPTGPFDKTAVVIPAGPANAQIALNFLRAELFSNYSEEFLQKVLPLKILLAERMNYTYPAYTSFQLSYPEKTYSAAGREGHDQITFGWANKLATGFTPQELDSARGQLNASLLMYATRRGILPVPTAFRKIIPNYADANSEYKRNGVLLPFTGINVYFDMRDYLTAILTNDYATLNSTILSPQFDTYGTYRKKYNALVNFYKDSLAIDLQAIGNK